VDAQIAVGARGQFDVVLDGETIASRQKGLLIRLIGGGWPDEDQVVNEVERRRSKAPK